MRQKSEDDIYLYTKQYLESQIAVALAGAAAEEIVLGNSSTGAANDFEQAVNLAKRMIFSGMSELGVVDRDSIPPEELHKEISNIVTSQKNHVFNLLKENEDVLQKISEYLIENEKIDGDTFRNYLKDFRAA
jgi:ATP-dependent Zn protease